MPRSKTGKPKGGRPAAKTAPVKRGSVKTQAAKRQLRRKKLLTGVVFHGQSVTAAAAANGVTRTFASREINSPESEVLLAEMVNDHAPEIRKLLELGLEAIHDCITPTQIQLQKPKKGEKQRKYVEMPNDPKVRLTAFKRVIDVSLAGRRRPDDAGKNNTISLTWDQFSDMYTDRQRRLAAQQEKLPEGNDDTAGTEQTG